MNGSDTNDLIKKLMMVTCADAEAPQNVVRTKKKDEAEEEVEEEPAEDYVEEEDEAEPMVDGQQVAAGLAVAAAFLK